VSAQRIEVPPTRLELIAMKRRKTLAEGIADILQKDLEVLIISLVEHRERASVKATGVLGIQFPFLKLIKQAGNEHKPRLSLFGRPNTAGRGCFKNQYCDG